MANQPKPKESKYKSIDDILEALKDNSSEAHQHVEAVKPMPTDEVIEDEEPIEELPSPEDADQLSDDNLDQPLIEDEPLEDIEESSVDSPSEEVVEEPSATHVKTAKQLLQDLQTNNPTQPDKQEEEVEFDRAIPSADIPPQHSSVFGDDPRPMAQYAQGDNFETRYNIDPDYPVHPHTSHQAIESENAEHSLNDLALEDEAPTPIPQPMTNHAHIPQAGVMHQHHQTGDIPIQPRRTNFAKSEYTVGEPTKRGSKLPFLIILIIGVVVIGATVYLLKNQLTGAGKTVSAPTPIPTPVIQPTILPTPTPLPVLDRSTYKVRVLNGTAKTGFASSISGKLKDLGYQQDRVGNATNSAFLQTIIRLKPSAASLSAQLIQDLSPELSGQSEGELRANDSADAEVIIGQQ